MSRNKGTFKFAASLEVQAASLLDPREKVETKAELINKETWPYEGDTLYLTEGLRVSVVDEQAVYMLVDVTKALDADYSGWKRIDAASATQVEVVDNLTSDSTTAALSAAQGKALNTEITSIKNKIAAVFTFKGSKENLTEIETVENPNVGDVWHNKENSGEYVYDGTTWEFLGINVDLSSYAKTEDVTSAIFSAKEELNTSITGVQTDLQGKIDQKVDVAEGKSLVDDTLIDQITQNKTDIEALTTNLSTVSENVNTVTGDVETLKTNVSDLKVKDVDATASNGVSLNLSDSGLVGVSVDAATLASKVQPNLALKADEIKLKSDIADSTYTTDSTIQSVLSDLSSRVAANTRSISAAVAGGVTSVAAGNGVSVDSTTSTQPKVSVKLATDGNIQINSNGEIDFVWLGEE